MLDINNLIMSAMKAKDKVASETYKMLKAKILEFKTAKNAKEYDESAEISLIQKMVQERFDSANIYKENGRHDLADAELAQADVLSELLPPIPTEDDIIEYLNEYYPSGIEKKSMGLVIKEVKEALIGADGKLISECVRSKLI